jgi:DNA polymerase III subunit delta'
MMFENFFGNSPAQGMLDRMIRADRIPQTILLAGPEGVGKATLARRFAARVVASRPRHVEKIEADDLSLPANQETFAEREKWPSEKRAEDPLLFGSHPDFLTFAPDGPLRQISIQQMRLLKEHAAYTPSAGKRRVFLIDSIDRANEQAANSLLKILEEPPAHLILIMTSENPYSLLPTIRSRSVILYLGSLSEDEMRAFAEARQIGSPERRIPLAQGSPGAAISLDLDAYDRRRTAMLALLEAAAGAAPWSAWARHAESLGGARGEKLESHLKVLYILLEDLLLTRHQMGSLRNPDLRNRLETIASRVSFPWIRKAVRKTDELAGLLRRSIQKGIALDAFVLDLRSN